MNNESKNKIFDVVLTEALKEYMDTELDRADELVQTESCEFSNKLKKRVHKIGNSIGRADRIKLLTKTALKTVVSAAAAFGIIFCMLLTQPEVYAAVQSTIRNIFDTHDRFEFSSEAPAEGSFDDTIRLGYVLEGYYLSNGDYTPIDVVLTYTNTIDEIVFEYGFADGMTVLIDNEHYEYEQFSSNGIEYHYYKSTDADFTNQMLWEDDGYVFILDGQLSKDEFVKIAENIGK